MKMRIQQTYLKLEPEIVCGVMECIDMINLCG